MYNIRVIQNNRLGEETKEWENVSTADIDEFEEILADFKHGWGKFMGRNSPPEIVVTLDDGRGFRPYLHLKFDNEWVRVRKSKAA